MKFCPRPPNKPFRQVVGIIGGLIIGQAAVTAGLVSPVMVVIVALTAIGGFAIPNFDLGSAFRITRFTLMIASAFLGLYGLVCGLIVIVVHLSSINSFGIPYLSPWGPFSRDILNSIVRLPITENRMRSAVYSAKDQTKMGGKLDAKQRD
jgi:spore germination protein